MPLYLVEREHAEKMGLAELGATSLDKEDLEEGLRWVLSFLSADKRKSYCLYEAASAAVVEAKAQRAGLSPAVVVQVDQVDRALLQAPTQ
jgi:hypothetical protein